MCGIFGWISKDGRKPSIKRLKLIAAFTESRGRHAFGLAWIDDDGLHTFKRPGAATEAIDDLDQCENARVIIGHCRWATHGDHRNNRNNHPHRSGTGWIVHNGVVHNYLGLIHQHELRPTTECDSEVLGLMMCRTSGNLSQRAARTIDATVGPLAMLGIWHNPDRLLVAKRGNPLWYSATEVGGYFASQPQGMPGQPEPVAEGYAGVLTGEGITNQWLNTEPIVEAAKPWYAIGRI